MNDELPDCCSICLEQFVQPVKLPCGHVFCFLCVKGSSFRRRLCPLCRRPISLSFFDSPEIIRVQDESEALGKPSLFIKLFFQMKQTLHGTTKDARDGGSMIIEQVGKSRQLIQMMTRNAKLSSLGIYTPLTLLKWIKYVIAFCCFWNRACLFCLLCKYHLFIFSCH